jgi:murein DD-endopeptidase MepM/ murein hydrolase activator NlpD
MHTGVDWSAPLGTPVHAAGAGRVLMAAFSGAYGNAILIDHGAGWQTLYSQLASFAVGEGDCVSAATLIGRVGSTGLSVGPHLHFEVRRDGRSLDPMTVQLKTQASRIKDKP